MSITKSFIEILEGKIEVSSTPGKGTQFKFQLPIDIAQEQVHQLDLHERTEIVSLDPAFTHLKILVADDDDENRTLLVSLLEKVVGFQVREARNMVKSSKLLINGKQI